MAGLPDRNQLPTTAAGQDRGRRCGGTKARNRQVGGMARTTGRKEKEERKGERLLLKGKRGKKKKKRERKSERLKEYNDMGSEHRKEKNRCEKMKETEKQNRVDGSKNKTERQGKDSSLEHLPQTSSLGHELDCVLPVFKSGRFGFLLLQSST